MKTPNKNQLLLLINTLNNIGDIIEIGRENNVSLTKGDACSIENHD